MNDRLIILEALLLIEKGEDYGSRIIRDVLDKYSYLDRQHRSFIKRVLEGTLERRIELDYIIDLFSKTPTTSMKPVILCILRMSVYQLKYMDSIPASAICNEAVKLAEKKGFHSLKGFVNGILRNISRNIDSIEYPNRETDEVSYLSVTYSMPSYPVELFLENYGDETEDILKAFFRENITTVRLNESKENKDEIIRYIEEDGAKIRKAEDSYGLCNNVYILDEYDILTELEAFGRGLFQVQDMSAMLPVEISGIKKGDTVIDVCAAPGGKTIQAVDKLCQLGGGTVYSFDVSDNKIDRINENLERCDFDDSVSVKVDVVDATEHHDSYVNLADVIIADLPCSGLGIIGRKSDIKYNVSKQGTESLVKLQRDILSNVIDYLKDGGTLMYSTCTLNPSENEEQVKWMTENLPLKCLEMHRIMPSSVRDGFFVARMIKS